MGRLVAGAAEMPLPDLYEQYQDLFAKALSLVATLKKNASVLMHMMGYFKKQLTGDESPDTPRSAPGKWGDWAGSLRAACGLWQSTHSTCLGAVLAILRYRGCLRTG